VAVAIFMLQTLTIQSGATRCAAQQETTGTHITGSPGKVTNTLKTEHGIKNEERDHWHAIVGVTGGRRNPRRHGAGLGNAFLQNLALGVLFVEHQLVRIYRCIKLSFR